MIQGRRQPSIRRPLVRSRQSASSAAALHGEQYRFSIHGTLSSGRCNWERAHYQFHLLTGLTILSFQLSFAIVHSAWHGGRGHRWKKRDVEGCNVASLDVPSS